MNVNEIDPIVKQALKLLHSSTPDSAEKIRISIDEIIKQRFGPSKMLINTLNKRTLAEEKSFPGIITVKREKYNDKTLAKSSDYISDVAENVNLVFDVKEERKEMEIEEDEENLKEFGDLACVVCGAMVFAANNRLVECADCHSLYHQECHKPHISNDDANEQEYSWCCTNCKNKVMLEKTKSPVASPSKLSSSSSSTSSSSNHSYYKGKHHERSNSKTKSSSKSSSSASKTSVSGKATPPVSSSSIISSSSSSKPSISNTSSINILNVDKRLQIMKKKAAKQQETKRKHK